VTTIVAVIAGAIFAVGLAIGGMTIPSKITAFLDVGGAWDPALAFVMAGALAVYAPLSRVIRRRPAPVLDARFHVPAPAAIDARLIGGAMIFGVGWGLSGYCPGPALVSLGGGGGGALVFVAAMVVGIVFGRRAG
jgi:uncharacterized membrane protein YedE/YeeE